MLKYLYISFIYFFFNLKNAVRLSVMENENTSIVKDSSILLTKFSDHIIEQEPLL
jgi:hypothetical protein